MDINHDIETRSKSFEIQPPSGEIAVVAANEVVKERLNKLTEPKKRLLNSFVGRRMLPLMLSATLFFGTSGCTNSSPELELNYPQENIPQLIEPEVKDEILIINKQEQTKKIVNEIHQKYGVEVVANGDLGNPNENEAAEKVRLLDWETPALAQVIKESLGEIPAVADLIQVMFLTPLYGKSEISNDISGQNLGFWWGGGRAEFEKSWRPFSQFPESESAVEIFFIGKVPFDKIHTMEPYPVKNYTSRALYGKEDKLFLRKYLQWTITHEIGHAFENKIRRAYREFLFGPRYFDASRKEQIDMEHELYVSHPLFTTLEKVVDLDTSKPAKARGVDTVQKIHSSSGNEIIADFFAESIMSPQNLSPKERQYFENVKDGLRKYGKEFFKMVAERPEILLAGIS